MSELFLYANHTKKEIITPHRFGDDATFNGWSGPNGTALVLQLLLAKHIDNLEQHEDDAEFQVIGRWAGDSIELCGSNAPGTHKVKDYTPGLKASQAWRLMSTYHYVIAGDKYQNISSLVRQEMAAHEWGRYRPEYLEERCMELLGGILAESWWQVHRRENFSWATSTLLSQLLESVHSQAQLQELRKWFKEAPRTHPGRILLGLARWNKRQQTVTVSRAAQLRVEMAARAWPGLPRYLGGNLLELFGHQMADARVDAETHGMSREIAELRAALDERIPEPANHSPTTPLGVRPLRGLQLPETGKLSEVARSPVAAKAGSSR